MINRIAGALLGAGLACAAVQAASAQPASASAKTKAKNVFIGGKTICY